VDIFKREPQCGDEIRAQEERQTRNAKGRLFLKGDLSFKKRKRIEKI